MDETPTIWMAIAPDATMTRVVAMHGPREPIARAALRRTPSSPHALAALLEAIALWEGHPVRAALVVDAARGGCDTTLYRDAALGLGATPLYSLTWLDAAARATRPGDALGGARAFRALERRLAREVAR